MNEKYYIKRIKKGNHHALDTFIELLYPQVYSFIYKKVKGDDIVNDLTQEVFVKFIKSLPTYTYENKVMNYLYKISSHVCYSYYRGLKIHLDIKEDILEDTHINVHETLIKQFSHDELIQAIQSLKSEEQDVIILKYFEQYTFKEISKIYNQNISTIKSRHYQALTKLKKIMEGGVNDDR